jgi:HTH-type transcriptional regulator, sugar sensing transcriptional regulator
VAALVSARELTEHLAGFGIDLKALNIDLPRELEEAVARLELVGLTTYEARAYIALIGLGVGTAEIVSNAAEIPRTSAYKVLESLERKGFVSSTDGRPQNFRPNPPDAVQRRVVSDLEDTFGKLQLLHELSSQRGMPQLIFTITGKERVVQKIAEIIKTTGQTLWLSTPAYGQLRDAIDKLVVDAAKRGVAVTIITDAAQGVPAATAEKVRLIRRAKLIATDMVADGRQALIASAELDACGYVDNPMLAEHLHRFFEAVLETSGEQEARA